MKVITEVAQSLRPMGATSARVGVRHRRAETTGVSGPRWLPDSDGHVSSARTSAPSVTLSTLRPMRVRVLLWLPAFATIGAACSGGSSGSIAALGPSSPTTQSAKAILFDLNHGDLNVTVPPQPCSTVKSGAVGPLQAPYKVCATSTAEGHFVEYIALTGSLLHGVSFTDRGPETFLDECYQHLIGQWWSWQAANLENPATPCTGAWHFHGGP